MHLKLLDVLGCPRCRRELACVAEKRDASDEVETGTLRCAACAESYPIRSGIPRFVPDDVYASSFGYQWNRFRTEQLDSVNGTTLSRDRLYGETGWSDDWLRGKWVLDAGCGAGRFLDVVAESGADVVGLDISSAIDAARANLNKRPHVHFVQASLYDMPFRDGAFDGVYCIGVIQHTPDPLASVRALPRVLKAEGRIAYTIYEKRRFTRFCSKYLVRPLSTKLGQRTLLGLIRGAMPVLFPLTEAAFRLPVLGRAFQFAIPVANYVGERQLGWKQRYAWAVLDTFDMLAPRYDQPQAEEDVRVAMRAAGVDEVVRTPAGGLNLIGRKAPAVSVESWSALSLSIRVAVLATVLNAVDRHPARLRARAPPLPRQDARRPARHAAARAAADGDRLLSHRPARPARLARRAALRGDGMDHRVHVVRGGRSRRR